MRPSLFILLCAAALMMAGCSSLPWSETTITETRRAPCPAIPVSLDCAAAGAPVSSHLDMTPAEIIRAWGEAERRGACQAAALDAWERAHAACARHGWFQ